MMIFGGLTLSTSNVHAEGQYTGTGISIQLTDSIDSEVRISLEEDSSGNGWSYNHTTNTLTLNNFNGYRIVMYENEPTFNILLKGNNHVASEIYSNSTMIIDGTSNDTLIVNNSDDNLRFAEIRCYGNLIINNINLYINGGENVPLFSKEANGVLNNLSSLEINCEMTFPTMNLKLKGMELLDENNKVLPFLSVVFAGEEGSSLFKNGTTQEYIDSLDLSSYEDIVALFNAIPSYVKGKKVSSYTATSGANQNLVEKEAKDATFTFDGPLEYLDKVYINDEELDVANYTTTLGSTIITLDKDYVSTLTTGSYTLKATYTNGVSASTDFVVKAKETTPTTPTNPSNPGVVVTPTDPTKPGTGTTSSNPTTNNTTSVNTGDNSSITLWTSLLMISGLISLGYVVLSKKRKMN